MSSVVPLLGPVADCFTASNGVRLLVPGGWPDPEDAPLVQRDPGLLTQARREAEAAGHDVTLAAQQRTAPPARADAALPKPARVRFASAAELLAKPAPVDWLVRDFLECDSVALLIGQPAAGKSFASIDLACCIATGTPWNGRRTKPGAVFIIAGEGHRGLRRRLLAWQIARRVSLADAPLFITQRAATVTEPDTLDDVAESIEALAGMHDTRPVLVIVDTVARAFRGDENHARDMGEFLSAVDQIRHHWGAAVLLVHHTGHGPNDRARGSSALRGAVDHEYLVSREEDRVVLTCTKSKDSAPPAPMHFALREVELPWADAEGTAQTSAVLDPAAAPDTREPTSRQALGANQQRALQALFDLYQRQRDTLERGGHPGSQALVLLQDWRDAVVPSIGDRREFSRIKKTLAERGAIVLEIPHVRLP